MQKTSRSLSDFPASLMSSGGRGACRRPQWLWLSARRVSVFAVSALPFSALPLSALPFSALPFSALPLSALPLLVGSPGCGSTDSPNDNSPGSTSGNAGGNRAGGAGSEVGGKAGLASAGAGDKDTHTSSTAGGAGVTGPGSGGRGGTSPTNGGSGGGAGTTSTGRGGTSGDGGKSNDGGVAKGAGGAAGRTGGSGGSTGSPDGGRAGSGGSGKAGGAGLGGSDQDGGQSSAEVGATPPMGWNSWNAFNCNGLNESVVKGMADAFISTGMKDVGYQYVNLDDCWMDGRDSSGKLKWNTSKFPAGIPALAEYIHNKGLKIGIYETPNTQTCAGLYGGYSGGVGSKGHETQDAQAFASWGIDYLKYDKCKGDLSGFAVMRDALRATGRPIFYSINPADQGPYCVPSKCSIDLLKIANMWRIEFDISANWKDVLRLIDADKNEYAGAGPGHWNDPDMLEVGNGLNDTDGRAHFSMWAMLAAPLITGNDLTKMNANTKATLTNAEVIAVDQDPLGKQARVVATPGTNLQVWSKDLSGTNARAVALFNRNDSGSASIAVKWSDIGLPAGAATVRDLWSHTDLGSFTDSYTAEAVGSHAVVMLKISGAAQ